MLFHDVPFRFNNRKQAELFQMNTANDHDFGRGTVGAGYANSVSRPFEQISLRAERMKNHRDIITEVRDLYTGVLNGIALRADKIVEHRRDGDDEPSEGMLPELQHVIHRLAKAMGEQAVGHEDMARRQLANSILDLLRILHRADVTGPGDDIIDALLARTNIE